MPTQVQAKVPLTKLNEKLFAAIKQRTDPHVIVKPERVLGAVYTSDKVARRKPVVMCEECWRKYRNWWKQAHYRPDWGWNYRSDCDGCSRRFVVCTLFVGEELFAKVLDTDLHGINPQP